MSQRPPASGPSSSVPPQAPPATSDQGRAASQSQQYRPSAYEPSRDDRSLPRLHVNAAAPEAQQRRPAGPEVFTGEAPPRSLGVYSILNPAQHEPTITPARPRFLDSPRSIASSIPQSHRASITSSPGLPRSHEHTPPTDAPSTIGAHPPRRVLTPKSPRLQTGSFGGRLSQPTGTISAAEAPFAPSTAPPAGHVYKTEPGRHSASEVPPMPSAVAPARLQSLHPQASGPTPADDGRRQSGGALTGPSQSASPTTSHSSYSQFSQTSPAQGYGLPPPQMGSYQQSSYGQSTHHAGSQASELAQSHFDTSGSIGPGNYSMSFQTDQGTIHVPVDIQAASKMADEKRRRNAGASARFRQRRKEKERESSQTISKLEQTLRDVTEEREFYRMERNYFRDAYSRTVGPGTTAPRPTSPRLRRLPPPIEPDSPGTWQDEERGGQSERNTRRRTSSYQPGYPIPPPAPSLPIGPPPGPPNVYAPPAPQYQPTLFEPRPTAPPASLPPAPLPPRTTSYDPFRREAYDRSWNPGP